MVERVTGLGGPFIKAKDPQQLAAWYEKHLGIAFNGTTYAAWQPGKMPATGFTLFSIFPEDSDYFSPSRKDVMVNFMVKDLKELLAALKNEGVEIVGNPVEEEYGKFGWVLDPEGNKIELWEPPV
ncbi:MAG: VOC family protein [Sphingobacteriales bacterium]|nr:VOC family protein [Sphingobacteriales bacterium]